MGNYCILRFEKIKTFQGLDMAEAHNARTAKPANANPTIPNVNLLPSSSLSVREKWQQILEKNNCHKYRKNAVLAIEFLMTFSPEKSDDIAPQIWASTCMLFICGIFGKENVISAWLHVDEKTPHAHVILVPLFHGRLCCAHWLDGPEKIVQLQNDFHTQVGAKFGLERGEIGSIRKHIPQKQMYLDDNVRRRTIDDIVQSNFGQLYSETKIDIQKLDFSSCKTTAPDERETQLRLRVEKLLLMRAEREQIILKSVIAPLVEKICKFEFENKHRIQLAKAHECLSKKHFELEKKHDAFSSRFSDVPFPRIAERILGVKGQRQENSFVWKTDAHFLVVSGTSFLDKKFPVNPSHSNSAICLVMHLLQCDSERAVRFIAAEFPELTEAALNCHRTRNEKKHSSDALKTPQPITFSELLSRFGKADQSQLGKMCKGIIEHWHIPSGIILTAIKSGSL